MLSSENSLEVFSLDGQIGTTESWSSTTRVIADDGFNGSVKSRTEQEQADHHYKDVNDGHNRPARAGEQLALVKLPVRDGEVDESEEGVEGGSEKGEEISHARHNLGEDESDGPDANHDAGPSTPSDDCVAVCVSRLAHDAEVDELGTDIGIDDTDHQGRNDDKREGSLFV